MSIFKKKMEQVKQYFKIVATERNPIVNQLLQEKTEEEKALYFAVLCFLVGSTGEPNEKQIAFLRRLISGADTKSNLYKYKSIAMELDIQSVRDFVATFCNGDLKYYFYIDASVIMQLGKVSEEDGELFSEILKVLNIRHYELESLDLIVKSIVMQSITLYEKAKSVAAGRVLNLSMYQYLYDFYNGKIVDTQSETHIYSFEQDLVSLSKYTPFLHKQKVIIESISDVLTKDIEIFGEGGGTTLIIRNCKLSGDNKYKFRLENIDTVIIENCEIRDFTERFMISQHVNNFIIRNNEFINCGYRTESYYARGGVFADIHSSSKSIILEGNYLRQCYIVGSDYSLGIFFRGESVDILEVNDNQFDACYIGKERNSKKGARYSYVSVAEAREVIEENNMSHDFGIDMIYIEEQKDGKIV